MIVCGIDLDSLVHVAPIQYPNTVKGRVVHIDADFLAYECSYEKEGEEKSFHDMCNNTDVVIESIRRYSAAETYILYLTPHGSNKGGRFDIALLKEYQANRKDRTNKPRMLDAIREWMHKERNAVMCIDCEADDAMSEAQYKAVAEGKRNWSIIASGDKDLNMVPGLHLDMRTRTIVYTRPFGKIWLDEKKKLRGYGNMFFWAQMLMGDTADNISGIPGLGPVKAYNLLKDIDNNTAAFQTIKTLYADYEYADWRTQDKISTGEAILSEAKLLWMRRNKTDQDDVIKWLKRIS